MPFWHSAARHQQRIAMNHFMKALNLWKDNQRRSSVRAPIVTAQPMPPLSEEELQRFPLSAPLAILRS